MSRSTSPRTLAGESDAARPKRWRVDFSRSAPYFVALLLLALVAFWPTYLSRIGAATGYTHAHAVLATAWLLLLIAQPLAIRDGQPEGAPGVSPHAGGLRPGPAPGGAPAHVRSMVAGLRRMVRGAASDLTPGKRRMQRVRSPE